MGDSITTVHYGMKWLVSTSVLAFCASARLLEREEASSLLRVKRRSSGTDIQQNEWGQYKACPYPGHKMCDKNNGYWEQVKDHFEEQEWAPEDAVDDLENCVNECWLEEGIIGWGGAFRQKTNEERISNYKEGLEEGLTGDKPWMKDCNKCIPKLDTVNEFNPARGK